jgi:glycine oxidase
MVTVRGAGIIGLSVAWSCLALGARVRVVDPAGPAAGASGGVVGAMSPFLPEPWTPLKALQLASLSRSAAFWEEVDRTSGLASGYGPLPRVMPLADEAAVSRARALAPLAAARWGEAGAWRIDDADDWAPSPTGKVAVATLAARAHPRRATRSLAAALRRRGVEIVPDVPDAPDAGAVVWATGHAGLARLGIGRGIKGQGATLALDAAGRPQIHGDDLYIVPHLDGTVGVGSTTEAAWSDLGTDARLDAMLARARAVCPMLEGAPVVERWAGARPRADTRQPVLGAWPGRPGHYIANGAFKIGFSVAVEVGRLVAALVVGGRDGIPPPFRVEPALARAGAAAKAFPAG